MIVFIYTTQPEILVYLKNRIEKKNHSCLLFTSKSTLFIAIHNSNFVPDLLLCDFDYENPLAFNMVQYINNLKLYLPTVFYNDPIMGDDKAYIWKTMIDMYYNKDFDKKPDRLKPENVEMIEVLKITESFVNSPKFKPYIKFMQKPLPYPKKFTLDYYDSEEEPYAEDIKTPLFEFKRKTKLPENLFTLLEIFYEQPDESIRAKHICARYKEKKKQISEKSLVVLISQLRKYFKENPEFKFYIQHNKDTYTFHAG